MAWLMPVAYLAALVLFWVVAAVTESTGALVAVGLAWLVVTLLVAFHMYDRTRSPS